VSRSADGTAAGQDDGAQILSGPGELDLAMAGSQYRRDGAAIRRHIRLLVLDLTGLSFCETCRLSAFVRIASKAETAGCCHGLIAPQPLVGKTLRSPACTSGCRYSRPSTRRRLRLVALAGTRMQPLGVGGCASGTVAGAGRNDREGD
jgi:anti-anti-sigma regulatory factor